MFESGNARSFWKEGTRHSGIETRLQSAFRAGCVSLMAREVPIEIEALFGDVPVGRSPAIRIAGTPLAVADKVRSNLAAAGCGSHQLVAWLWSDIRELAASFASVTGVAFVGLQLAPFIDDRRLDYDGLGHRLVTSYRGSDGSWLRPRMLGFLPPAWPVPPGIGRQPEQVPHADRLFLCIDDYGRC